MSFKMSLGELSAKLGFDTSGATEGAKKFTNTIQKTDMGLMRLGEMAQQVAAKVTDAFDEMIKLADKQAMAERSLEIAAKKSADAFDVEALKKFASARQNLTTFGDEATIAMMGMTATFVDNGNQVAQLTPHIQDMAERMGGGEGSLRSSAMAVGRAIAGQAEGLSRYGVVLSEEEKKAFKFMKTQERVTFVSEKLQAAVGGLAEEAAKTGAGSMKQFDNATGDLKETLGKLLESDYAAWFGSLTKAVQGVDKWVQQLSPDAKKLATNLLSWGGGLTAAAGGLAAIAFALPSVAAGVGMLAATFGPFLLQAAAIAAVAGVIQYAWGELSLSMKGTFVNAMLATAQAIAQILNALLVPWRLVGDMLATVGEKLGNVKMMTAGYALQEVKVEFDTTLDYFGVAAGDAGLEAGKKLADGITKRLKGLGKDLLSIAFPKMPDLPEAAGGGGFGDGGDGSGGGGGSNFVDAPAWAGSQAAAPFISSMKSMRIASDDNTVQLEIAARKQARLSAEYDKASKSINQLMAEGFGKMFGGGAGDAVGQNMADAITSGGGFGSAIGSALGLAAGGAMGVSVGSAIGSIGDKIGQGFTDLMHAMAPSLTETIGGPLGVAALGFASFAGALFGLEIAFGMLTINALAQTDAVAKTQQMFEDLNSKLVDAFEPLAERLIPIAYVLVQLLSNWIDRLVGVMSQYDIMGNALYRVWTMFAALSVAMQHFRISVLDLRIGFQQLLLDWGSEDHTAIDALINARYREGQALNNLTDTYSEMMVSADGAAESLNSLNSSATNVPSGYKTNASIFSSQTAVNVYVNGSNGKEIGQAIAGELAGMRMDWGARS